MPSDELLHEIGFLDICPTILRSCELDPGNDLDGCAVQDYAEHNVPPRKQVDPMLGEVSEDKIDLNTEMRGAQFSSFIEPFLHKPARHVEKKIFGPWRPCNWLPIAVRKHCLYYFASIMRTLWKPSAVIWLRRHSIDPAISKRPSH